MFMPNTRDVLWLNVSSSSLAINDELKDFDRLFQLWQ